MSLYEALANTTVTICTDLPFRVNSLGLWNRSERWTVNATTPLVNFSFPLQNYTMPILEFEMTLMFVLTELTHLFLKIFGIPALAAQLVVSTTYISRALILSSLIYPFSFIFID